MKIKYHKETLQDFDLNMEIKRKTLRKIDLEIQKLEREISDYFMHTVSMTMTQCIKFMDVQYTI